MKKSLIIYWIPRTIENGFENSWKSGKVGRRDKAATGRLSASHAPIYILTPLEGERKRKREISALYVGRYLAPPGLSISIYAFITSRTVVSPRTRAWYFTPPLPFFFTIPLSLFYFDLFLPLFSVDYA